MTLQMTNARASKMSLEGLPMSEVQKETPDVNLTFRAAFNIEDPKIFAVVFSLEVETRGEFQLSLEYWVSFEASEEIAEDQRDSPFFAINAPAIGFPFLRSYVSLILVNGGYNNTILGSVNFVELYERNQTNSIVGKE